MSLKALSGEALFTTPRLLCRRWLPDDLQSILEVYADPEGARWVGDGKPLISEDGVRWLSVTAANYEARGYGMFALEDVGSKACVGFCGLVHPDAESPIEVKYAFLRSHWGQGLASEALEGLLQYAHSAYAISNITATVAAENLPSQRVLVKNGFAFHAAWLETDGAVTFRYQQAPSV